MPITAQDTDIAKLDRVAIALESWSWRFAAERRDEIDRQFAQMRRERPALWNGRVLLLHRFAVADGVLDGACFETDYASFITWREWGFPDRSVYNVFAAAALQTADGAYLLGEMAAHTAGAGQICFPCGTPEPGDVRAGMLDLAGNLRRELREETGLDIGDLDSEPGWTLVRDRGYVALLKRLTARASADELRARIRSHLAAETQPELTDMCIVRGPADVDPRMPRFVRLFLQTAG